MTFDFGGPVAFTSPFAGNVDLYTSGKFSDLTITCKGRTWNVHRSVVCIKCPFFQGAMTSGMQEAQTGIIDLPDDDPDTVARLIQFLYTSDYYDSKNQGPAATPIEKPASASASGRGRGRGRGKPHRQPITWQHQLANQPARSVPIKSSARNPMLPIGGTKAFADHSQVWVISDKFMLRELGALALEKFIALIASSKDLEADGLLDCIQVVFEGTSDTYNRGFRDVLVLLMYEKRAALLELDGFNALMVEYGAIGQEMLQLSAADPFRRRPNASQLVWKCMACGSRLECGGCGSGLGGFIVPPNGYERGEEKFVVPNYPWSYVCHDPGCGHINAPQCHATMGCEVVKSGKYVHVSSLSPEVRRALAMRPDDAVRIRRDNPYGSIPSKAVTGLKRSVTDFREGEILRKGDRKGDWLDGDHDGFSFY